MQQEPLSPASTERVPYKFQKIGAAWLDIVQRGLLADDPGLGKSMQALMAARGNTLIVAPAMILDGGDWETEVEAVNPDAKIFYWSYTGLCQHTTEWNAKLKKNTSRVLSVLKPEVKGPWDTVIFDEAHYLKERHTTWVKAVTSGLKTDRMFLISGWPIPNWSYEILPLLRLLYPGDKRFTDYWRWVERWYGTYVPAFGGRKVGKLRGRFTWEDFVNGNGLAEKMYRRTWDDVGIQLPPLSEEHVYLDMKPDQRRFYDRLKSDYFAATADGFEVSAWDSGGLSSKLAMCATGVEVATLGGVFPYKGSAKLQYVIEFLKGRPGQQVILFCQFRATARYLIDICRKLGRTHGLLMGGEPDRGKVKKDFTDGKLDTLVGTFGVVTEGLNLQKANVCMFVEHSWTPSKNMQAIRRLWRLGQTRPVLAVHLWTKKSADDGMRKVLTLKTDETVQMMKAIEFAHAIEGY